LRLISLTPTLSKVLESLVGRRLLPKIAPNFDKNQFGALTGRSTTHAQIDITHKLHQVLDDQNSARCLFIDFTKTFDHVDHTTVLKKLSAFGVDPLILRWLHSFLHNRQQRVKIGNVTSQWSSLSGGMPQGTWLGPYVFLALIDDLHASLPLHKFVDDVTATEVIVPSTASQMQQTADQITQWSHLNQMIINTKKTKEMLFGSIKKQPPPQIEFNQTFVDRVDSFKLLGVHISDTLSWDNHVNAVCLKAGKRLFIRKLLKRSSVSIADLLQYYKAVIRPVIEHACPVWQWQSGLTAEQKDRLEAIQRRAMRTITGSDDYELQCVVHNVEPIALRLNSLSRSFFSRMCLQGLFVSR
jgi:hypothetical protein